MQRAAYLVALVVIIGALPLATDSVTAQSTSSYSGVICSRDYDDYGEAGGCSGNALPDASVRLSRASTGLLDQGYDQTVTTGDDGNYAFSSIADGEYTLDLSRPGFEPQSKTITVSGSKYADHTMDGLKVTQTGIISGEDGAKLSGASIAASGREYITGKTGADGSYSIGVTAGYYSLTVSHPEKRTSYDYVLLDGQSSHDVVLEDAPERTAKLSGKVTDQDGAGVPDVRIDVYQYGQCCYDYGVEEPRGQGETEPAVAPDSYYYEDNYQQATTDAAGNYEISMYAGYANLNAYKEGHASYYTDIEMKDGEERTLDFTMEKFPPKTAHIEGKITGKDGKGLKWASISVESPQYGLYECSISSSDSNGDSGGDSELSYYPGGGYSECAITINDDGTYSGDVSPGYTIINVYYQHWRSCSSSGSSDGSYQQTCGPEYYRYSKSMTLEKDSSTTLNIALKAKPGPDATLSGYVVDKETQKAIPGVQVSFSNQDSYSYAWATTDEDGSYKVKIRSGYQQISVYSDGYFRWQGVIDVPANGNVGLDIMLVAGQDRYGGHCCYAYAEDSAHGAPTSAPAADGAESPQQSSGQSTSQASGDESSSQAFEDQNGGLGPYDASKRAAYADSVSEVKGSPSPVWLMFAALGAVILAGRRRN